MAHEALPLEGFKRCGKSLKPSPGYYAKYDSYVKRYQHTWEVQN